MKNKYTEALGTLWLYASQQREYNDDTLEEVHNAMSVMEELIQDYFDEIENNKISLKEMAEAGSRLVNEKDKILDTAGDLLFGTTPFYFLPNKTSEVPTTKEGWKDWLIKNAELDNK